MQHKVVQMLYVLSQMELNNRSRLAGIIAISSLQTKDIYLAYSAKVVMHKALLLM